MVDGEKKSPMGYIYETMDRAKESIDTRKYESSLKLLMQGGHASTI